MTFLPIVERELRIRSRKWATYWVRAGAASLAAAFTALFGLIMFVAASLGGGGGAGKVGFALFVTLAWMTFVFCLIEGARSTADCLSEEKREGTLGLLFLTDLRAYDVVLGKFVAASVNSFYGVMAVFPVMGAAMLLGGVAPAQFWRMTLVLADTLFFALAAGVFVSALCRQQSRAWIGTLALVAGVTVLPALMAMLLPQASLLARVDELKPIASLLTNPNVLALAETIGRLSPAMAFVEALASGYGNVSGGFWSSLLGIQTVGWLLLAFASAWLPRAWQDGGRDAAARRRWYAVKWPVSNAAKQARAARRARLLGVDPVMWLASRDRGSNWLVWVAVLLTVAGQGSIIMLGQEVALFVTSMYGIGLFPIKVILEVWVAVHACRFFAEARAAGALELFLTTPLSSRDIVKGQLLALRSYFLLPVVVLVAAQLAMHGIATWSGAGSQDMLFAGMFTLFSLLLNLGLFVMALLATVYFGMWLALTLKKPGHALGLTVLTILVLPIPLAFCFCGLPTIGIYLFLFLWPKYKLETELRRRVAGDFGPSSGTVSPALPQRPPPVPT